MKSALQMKQRIQSLQPHAAIKQAHEGRTFYRTKHPKPMKQESTSYKNTSSKKKTPTSKGAEKPLSAKKRPKSAAKNVKTTAKPSKTHSSKSTKTLKIEKALRALAAARDVYDKIPPQLRAKAIDAAGEWLNRQDSRAPEQEKREVSQDLETFSLSLFSNSFDESADLCSGLFGQNFFWRGRARKNQEGPVFIAAQHVPIGDVSERRSSRKFEAAIARADFVLTTLDGGAATLSHSTILSCKWILSTARASRTPLLFMVLNSEENLTYGHEFVSPPGMRGRWADLMKRRKTLFAEAIGCGRDRLYVVSKTQRIGLTVVARQLLLLMQDDNKKRTLIGAFLPELIQTSSGSAPSNLRKVFKTAVGTLKTGGKQAVDWVKRNPELAKDIALALAYAWREVRASRASNRPSARKR